MSTSPFERTMPDGDETLATMLEMASTSVASAQRLTTLNLETARALFDGSVATATAVLAGGKTLDGGGAQIILAQPVMAQAVHYAQAAQQIIGDNQHAVNGLLAAQISASRAGVVAKLEQTFPFSRPGGAVFMDAVKQAVAAADTVGNQLAEAAQEMSDLAEANLAVATATATRVISEMAKTLQKPD